MHDFSGSTQISKIPKAVKKCQTKASMVKDTEQCKQTGKKMESKNADLRQGVDRLYAEMKHNSGIDLKKILRDLNF